MTARLTIRWRRALGALYAIAMLAVISCLPADTRPPPGAVRLSVTTADAPGVVTADGWTIAVDRLLLGVGYAGFNDPCVPYADYSARYDRLLDVRRPVEQKISHIFGLGQCYFGFQVSFPSTEALLGEGVTAADLERMGPRFGDAGRTRGAPVFGVPVDFQATATRGDTTKRIHWMLRQLSSYRDCGRVTQGGAKPQAIELTGDDDIPLRLTARGSVLFQDGSDAAAAALRFDPVALADDVFGDGNGDVTLDELAGVAMTVARTFGPYLTTTTPPPTTTPRPQKTTPETLEDYLYLELVPRMVGFPEGFGCLSVLGPGRR